MTIDHASLARRSRGGSSNLNYSVSCSHRCLQKAELKFSMAVNTGDASAGPEIMEMFDEAIREHPISATLYISKSAFLVQVRLYGSCIV